MESRMKEEIDVVETRTIDSSRSRHKQVQLTLTIREFDLPPIGDGVLIGRRAAIGPRGLFEAIDRMLPGLYELVFVEHPIVEAVIVSLRKTRVVPRDRLIALLLRQGEHLVSESTILRIDVDFEVRVQLEVEP
jgi:hypothetical protein